MEVHLDDIHIGYVRLYILDNCINHEVDNHILYIIGVNLFPFIFLCLIRQLHRSAIGLSLINSMELFIHLLSKEYYYTLYYEYDHYLIVSITIIVSA